MQKQTVYSFVALIPLVLWTIYSFLSGGLIAHLVRGDLDALSLSFQGVSYGLAVLLFIFLVVVEVVIGFIPGFLVYPLAGVLFGGFMGGVYVLLGNVIGSIFSYSIGYQARKTFSHAHKPSRWEKYMQSRGPVGLLLLRTNPFTSHDILVHIAGALRLPFIQTIVASNTGLLPYIFISTYFGTEVIERFEEFGGALLLIIGLYFMYTVIHYYKKK
jgi:uncharacterized membrane protein YdjX (TVP38/TMEM64 family)